jgi:hypothetical protein
MSVDAAMRRRIRADQKKREHDKEKVSDAPNFGAATRQIKRMGRRLCYCPTRQVTQLAQRLWVRCAKWPLRGCQTL